MSIYVRKPTWSINCEECGVLVENVHRPERRYCSTKCRRKATWPRKRNGSRLVKQRKRKARRMVGKCTFCANIPETGGATCNKCLLISKRSRLKRIKAGLCATCGEAATVGKLCLKHATENRASNSARNRLLREQVIEHYGGRCACCGEDTYEFLTLDHINNDGAKQRKEMGKPRMIYYIHTRRPTDIQVLCWNCNCAKAHHKVCPHRKMIRLVA